MEHINWWWLGISKIFCDLFRIFFQEKCGGDCSWNVYFAHAYMWAPNCIYAFSSWILLTNYAGLIMSFHMLDDVARGMFTPYNEIAFTNTTTNTISSVLCISEKFVCCLGGEFFRWNSVHSSVSKDAEKFSINFCVIIFWHYIIFGHA